MERLAEEDETGYAKLMYEAEKAAMAAAEANKQLAQARILVNQVANSAVASNALKNAEEVESLQKLVDTYGKGKAAMIEYETAHQKAAADSQIIAAAFA